MRSIELIDGVIGYRSDIPTLWWTLHEKVDSESKPSVIATDDMFRLIAGQHLGEITVHPLIEGVDWFLRDVGTLWMIYIISGVIKMRVRDEKTETEKVLLAGMGLLAGGDVTFTCEVVQAGMALFVSART